MNNALNKSHRKAAQLMSQLEGEGMQTLTELKRMLEWEISHRVAIRDMVTRQSSDLIKAFNPDQFSK